MAADDPLVLTKPVVVDDSNYDDVVETIVCREGRVVFFLLLVPVLRTRSCLLVLLFSCCC